MFSTKQLTTIEQVVTETEADIEETLFRIDKLRERTILDSAMYDEAIASMAAQEEYSISKSFSEHYFWQGLSP